MCDQERACLFLIFLFSHCKDFYPNFDRPIQNSRLYHGVQSPIIYHLRATSNSSRFIWIKKLNYLFKLIVNPSLHLLCFLTSSLGRMWFSPGWQNYVFGCYQLSAFHDRGFAGVLDSQYIYRQRTRTARLLLRYNFIKIFFMAKVNALGFFRGGKG